MVLETYGEPHLQILELLLWDTSSPTIGNAGDRHPSSCRATGDELELDMDKLTPPSRMRLEAQFLIQGSMPKGWIQRWSNPHTTSKNWQKLAPLKLFNYLYIQLWTRGDG